MFLEMTNQEIALLSKYNLLHPQTRQEVQEYMSYILFRQYQRELYNALLTNSAIGNGLTQIIRLCEREETDAQELVSRLNQVKFYFYHTYEKVKTKYEGVLAAVQAEDSLLDLGRLGFENILQAIYSNDRQRIRREVEEFVGMFRKLVHRRDKRRIAAV